MLVEDERKIVQEVLLGNKKAFKRLVLEYENLVLHIVTPLIGVSEDREDICQEVFFKVYQSLGSFRHHSRLSTWIGNIAYNLSLNFLRKKREILMSDLNQPHYNDDEIDHPDTFFHDSANLDDLSTPEQNLMEKEMRVSISQAIEQLPKMQRIVIILFHFDELSIQEITKVLDIPENTVKSHLLRGRKSLSKIIKV